MNSFVSISASISALFCDLACALFQAQTTDPTSTLASSETSGSSAICSLSRAVRSSTSFAIAANFSTVFTPTCDRIAWTSSFTSYFPRRKSKSAPLLARASRLWSAERTIGGIPAVSLTYFDPPRLWSHTVTQCYWAIATLSSTFIPQCASHILLPWERPMGLCDASATSLGATHILYRVAYCPLALPPDATRGVDGASINYLPLVRLRVTLTCETLDPHMHYTQETWSVQAPQLFTPLVGYESTAVPLPALWLELATPPQNRWWTLS